MNFKSDTVLSIVDRVAPFIKKGVKSAEHPNRIYFKPSDLPIEELGEITNEIKVSNDAVVAPFAQRLIHPNLFGLSPAVNDVKQLVDNTYRIIDNCKDEAVKTGFSKLYSKILDNSPNLSKDTYRMTYLMDTVESIENPKVKAEILKQIEFLNDCKPKWFKAHYHNTMSFMEDYVDAVNTINGKYLRLDNKVHKFYRYMDKENIWLADIIDGTKKSEGTYRNRLLTSKKHNKDYEEYLRNFDYYTEKGFKETFENSVRQDAMSQFFNIYFGTRKEAINTLYHEEFLKTLPPDIAKECAEIQKEYNTYIINSNANVGLEDIKYIREELRLWREAGGKKAITPNVIYINTTDEYMISNKFSGLANSRSNVVQVRELLDLDGNPKSSGSTLRHEIQHLHDEDILAPKNIFDELGDFIVWRYNKIRYKKKWDKELEHAGITSKKHRDYAFTERAELRSVTLETETENLTEDFISQMEKKLKMARWMFRIGRNRVAQEHRMRLLNETSEKI